MGCSVFGALVGRADAATAADLTRTVELAKERGPDSAGLWLRPWANAGQPTRLVRTDGHDLHWPPLPADGCTVVVNLRGEPTTEVVWDKGEVDVQPFSSPSGEWLVSHNGTIPHDAELYAEAMPAGYRPPTRIDSYAIGVALDRWGWPGALAKLRRGSFAIVAACRSDPRALYYAANYQPLAYRAGRFALQVVSLGQYLEHDHDPLVDPGVHQIQPYTYGVFRHSLTGAPFVHETRSLFDLHPELQTEQRRVLVVCSGGLDSGTVAWKYHSEGWDVTLLHLQWRQKAERAELSAVMRLAEAMFGDQANDHVLIRDVGDFFATWAPSSLTNPEVEINRDRGGEAAAEEAFDWVPARNLNFVAQVTAIAETLGIGHIAIGTCLEEAGAFPDNNQLFGILLNLLLPYTVAPYTRVRLLQPFATHMKAHIVRDGLALGMPFQLTWSCYDSGPRPCGSCESCRIRQVAFQMNGVTNPAAAASPVAW